MSETVGQGGGMAAMARRGIGELLRAAFQLYRRYWCTLMAIAAVVVVPLTLVQYGIGHWVRSHGQQLHDQVVNSTSFWGVASAALLSAFVGLLLYQVLTGAITRTIATEVAGHDLDLEQSYRFAVALPYGAWSACRSVWTCARRGRLDLDTLKANLQATAA